MKEAEQQKAKRIDNNEEEEKVMNGKHTNVVVIVVVVAIIVVVVVVVEIVVVRVVVVEISLISSGRGSSVYFYSFGVVFSFYVNVTPFIYLIMHNVAFYILPLHSTVALVSHY